MVVPFCAPSTSPGGVTTWALCGAFTSPPHHLVATRVGDPMQLLNATCLRLVHFAAAGTPVSPKELAMRAQARELAVQVGPDGLA